MNENENHNMIKYGCVKNFKRNLSLTLVKECRCKWEVSSRLEEVLALSQVSDYAGVWNVAVVRFTE